MRKLLLSVTLVIFALSTLSLNAQYANKFKVKNRVSLPQQRTGELSRKSDAPSILLAQPENGFSSSGKKNQNAAGGDVLMSWDFEAVSDDNDWYVFDFDGFTTTWFGEPVGWTLYDETATNQSLISQSWFTEANATEADDWAVSDAFAIPSDANAYEASWEARAHQAAPFNDGYEFRIIEEADFISATSAFTDETELADASQALQAVSTLLYSTSGENQTWTEHRIALDAYKGKTVRLIWRNNSLDKNVLYLDNVAAYKKADYATAVKVTSYPVVPYAQVPSFLAKDYVGKLTAKVTNNGSLGLTGVTASVTGYANDVESLSEVIAIGTFASATSTEISSKDYAIQAASPANNYYFSVEVNAAEDALSYDETQIFTGPLLTSTVYARDNGTRSGYWSISSSNTSANKRIGTLYDLPAATKLNSVTFNLYNSGASSTIVRVYKSTGTNQLTQVAASSPVTITPGVSSEALYTATFENLQLEAGTYLVTIDEPASASIGIVGTSNYTGVTTFYTTNGTSWSAGTSTLYIRLDVSEGTSGISANELHKAAAAGIKGGFAVNGLQSNATATLYSVSGQKILQQDLHAGDNTVNSALKPGAYVLKVNGANYKILVK